MQNATRYIILTGLSAGCLSMIFFLSIACHVPFFITVPVVAAVVLFLFRWGSKGMKVEASEGFSVKVFLPYLILVACVVLMVVKVNDVAYKYGGWDAWCMWNLHAKYLATGNPLWKRLFLNPADHPDYPLLLPGVNGLFIRLFNGDAATVVPFVFSFFITLAIPVVIFLERAHKNIIVAGIVLFLFAQDVFYLRNGVSQYADTVLAFFLLVALVCIDNSEQNKRNVPLAALALGCCMWTKNEGVLLSFFVIAFHARLFFSSKNRAAFIAGILFPLLTLIVFKVGYAPANDVVGGQGKQTLQQLFIGVRYEVIWTHFTTQLRENFMYVGIAFALYLLTCVLQRTWPAKQFVMLLLCLVAYLMIYVVSPQELNWHLTTSLERLMHQLMPAFMYVMANPKPLKGFARQTVNTL